LASAPDRKDKVLFFSPKVEREAEAALKNDRPYRSDRQAFSSRPAGQSKPMTRKEIFAVWAAAGSVIVAGFLPWASVLGFSASGYDGDGKFTALMAGIAAAATLLYRRPRLARGFVAALGLGITITAVVDMVQILSAKTDFFGETIHASLGIGLVLTLLAGIILAFTPFTLRVIRFLNQAPTEPAAAQPTHTQ
jgi:hypothetical protein